MHFKLRLILVFALLGAAVADAEVTLDGSVGSPSINPGDPVAAGNGYSRLYWWLNIVGLASENHAGDHRPV